MPAWSSSGSPAPNNGELSGNEIGDNSVLKPLDVEKFFARAGVDMKHRALPVLPHTSNLPNRTAPGKEKPGKALTTLPG